VPDVNAVEEISYILGLTPYISDIDTPISQLIIFEDSQYVNVSGHSLILNYPNGITSEVVNITIFDGEYTCVWAINVTITPVNDAPTIGGIPSLTLVEDVPYILNVSSYINDIDGDVLTVSTNEFSLLHSYRNRAYLCISE
jgi:hypothetical protein